MRRGGRLSQPPGRVAGQCADVERISGVFVETIASAARFMNVTHPAEVAALIMQRIAHSRTRS